MTARIEARWFSDGAGAWIDESETNQLLRIAIDDWHEPGSRIGVPSWVVSFAVEGATGPVEHRRRLESGPAAPALDDDRRLYLTGLARDAAALGPPPKPDPLVFEFGEADALLIRQIEMLHVGWGEAATRVDEAARDDSEWAPSRLHRALTEALLWVRLIDDVLDEAWRQADSRSREEVSQETDRRLGPLLASEPDRAGSTAALRAYQQRQRDGEPYRDWATAAIGRGADTPEEWLDGFRWLAGKVLHLAPRPVVVLSPWRDGAEWRWRFRSAEEILPKAQERQRHWLNRAAYEHHLAGRDVVGSFDLTMTLIEVEHMFIRMRRRQQCADG